MKTLRITLTASISNKQAETVKKYGINSLDLNGMVTVGGGCFGKTRYMKVESAYLEGKE